MRYSDVRRSACQAERRAASGQAKDLPEEFARLEGALRAQAYDTALFLEPIRLTWTHEATKVLEQHFGPGKRLETPIADTPDRAAAIWVFQRPVEAP